MWGITLIVAACTLALIALSFAVGAPVLAVPIATLGVVVIGAFELLRRRGDVKERRESVDFTPRDRETLVSE